MNMASWLLQYFDSPWYLLLLVLAPIMWYVSRESLSGMGTVRRFFALTLRTMVLLLIVGSLAEIQYRRINDRLTVIYVLDQSESIPKSQRDTMLNFVKADVSQYRNDSKRDRAAVIVFGRDASIEVPPLEDDLPLVGRLESVYDLRPDATNLAQALKLALATFPEDASRRIVVVSDGNENEGDARAIAEMMVEDGVGIDVVPIQLSQRAEIEVDKVVIPVDTRKGQPFNASVVLNNLAQPTAQDDGTVRGKLRVWRRQGKQLDQISEEDIVLPPGKRVLQFRNTIDEPDFYEYQAEFVPDNPDVDDVLTQNNRATAFTQVLGAAHVLLIEDWEHPGEFDPLVNRLRKQDIQITVQGSDQLFASLAELQRYDCVVLANVPRSSGNVDVQTNFSDEQIDILVRTPETQVVVDYDINDYKEKTELTTGRLFATTVAALRGYADIRTIERYKQDAYMTLGHETELEQQILDFVREPLFHTDQLLIITGCNRAFLNLIGKISHAVVGLSVAEVLPREIAAQIQLEVKRPCNIMCGVICKRWCETGGYQLAECTSSDTTRTMRHTRHQK